MTTGGSRSCDSQNKMSRLIHKTKFPAVFFRFNQNYAPIAIVLTAFGLPSRNTQKWRDR
jgi:hypothetical protein